MMERVIVGDDILKHHGLKFTVVKSIEYKDAAEPNAFAVQLLNTETGESVGWLQGDADLDYNYMREYARQLGVCV